MGIGIQYAVVRLILVKLISWQVTDGSMGGFAVCMCKTGEVIGMTADTSICST